MIYYVSVFLPYYPACKSHLFCDVLHCQLRHVCLSYFSTLPQKGMIFGENSLLNRIPSRNKQDIIINVRRGLGKVPVILVRFLRN
jgi:hypothetical protein